MTQHPPTPAGPLAGADAAPHYVQRRTQDGIAVLTLAGPDGNRLGPDLVRALTSAFRAAQRDDGVRAVVLTARGADGDLELGRKAGADGFMTKPFQTIEVLKQIELLLAKKTRRL